MKKIIEFEQQCDSCGGTGVYVGMAERDGSAVICRTCEGTGKYYFKYTYEEFTEKKIKTGIKRVYQNNPGIGIGEKEGTCKLEDFGGMSYEDWFAGKKFKKGMEMRKYTCPAWYYQSADYKKKPNWEECIGIGSFSACLSFKNKEKCWEKFDKGE